MKKSLKLTMVALAVMALGTLSSCGGPSFCDCVNIGDNPGDANMEMVEKCADLMADMSFNEIQEKAADCE